MSIKWYFSKKIKDKKKNDPKFANLLGLLWATELPDVIINSVSKSAPNRNDPAGALDVELIRQIGGKAWKLFALEAKRKMFQRVVRSAKRVECSLSYLDDVYIDPEFLLEVRFYLEKKKKEKEIPLLSIRFFIDSETGRISNSAYKE